MTRQNEEKIREIERAIDDHHKLFPIFKKPISTVLLHTLRVFEDMCRLPVLMGASETELLETLAHNNLDALDMAVKWIYECCETDSSDINLLFSVDDYLEAGELIMEAGNYRSVCDSYILWSRGRQTCNFYESERLLEFAFSDSKKGTIEAADLVLREKKKTTLLKNPEVVESQIELLKIRDKLMNSIYFNRENCIVYNITEEIWQAFLGIARIQINSTSELPEEWNFTYFSLKEFKELWEVLLTKALIHNFACALSGVEGGAVESVVMVIPKEELCNEIHSKTNLSIDKVNDILNFIIFNPSIKNNDVIWQPLFLINNKYIISPHLIITNSVERNIISLINKIDQVSYSRLSNLKEDVMANSLSERLLGKLFLLPYNARKLMVLPVQKLPYIMIIS
ncbi:MAG: hypothetical protein VR67_17765 [Peptococcaceae bacterium BRH_c8a]|nr:MAG: hypothetical protein VR67_17765 [Peptococcaceae bacterium BRH_c8a]